MPDLNQNDRNAFPQIHGGDPLLYEPMVRRNRLCPKRIHWTPRSAMHAHQGVQTRTSIEPPAK